MLQHIGDVLPRYCEYQELFRDRQPLQDSLCKIYSEIVSFISRANGFFSQPKAAILAKSAWKRFDSEFEVLLNQLRRWSGNVEAEANVALMIEVTRTRAEIRELKTLVRAREEREEGEPAPSPIGTS